MKWDTKQLEEVADFRLGKMLDERKNKGDLMPYLANVNVRWGEFELGDLREMRFEDRELETYGLKHGDIVMCEGGEPGRCAIWKEQRPRMMIQKALHRIRPHECLNQEFLFYTFLYMGKTGRFAPLFTGATIKHLPREKLALLEIPIPPLPIQKQIAQVLSAYDELIANNQRRMGLLEKAARLLYEEWFIRLRFPGHEHTPIADGVPQGWQRGVIAHAAQSLEDGDWIESKDQGGEDYRLLQISNIGMNEFVETGNFRFITEDVFRRLNCRELDPGDILISRMPEPIGRAWLVTPMPWKMVTAVDAAILKTNDQVADPYFLLYHMNSEASIAYCEQHAGGATRPRITRRELAKQPLTLPSLAVSGKLS